MAESHSVGALRKPFMVDHAFNNLADAEVDVSEDMFPILWLMISTYIRPVNIDDAERCNDTRTSWEVWVMYGTLIWCESWDVRRLN